MSESNFDLLLKVRAEIDEELRRHKTAITILFTDVVASTAHFDRHGDTSGLGMLQRHADLGFKTVNECAGRVVKTIGDSILAEFAEPASGVRAAVEIQRRVATLNESLADSERLHIRIGINHGPSFRNGNDVYGDAVNLAARIAKRAGPAQILLSQSVFDAVKQVEGSHCIGLGTVQIQGKRATEEIFEIIWTDAEAYAELRQNLTAALARGDLVSPGMKLEELVQPRVPGVPPTRETKSAEPVATSAPGGITARYEILEELGRGGMGIVYKARDHETGELVALKVLKPEIASDEGIQERFKNELRLSRKITHRNVCRIHEFHRSEGTAYISMEFVDGQSLRSILNLLETMPLRKGLKIASQLCFGLKEAHQEGVVHRDLKPENIMVDHSGNAKIMDFGIARPVAATLTTMGTGALEGTPSYMSPEQADGTPVDCRADIYALGLILYEMFTGQRPFEADTPVAVALKQIRETPRPPRELEPRIPAQVEQVILKCLEKDPAKRFQSVAEMETELRRQSNSLFPETIGSSRPLLTKLLRLETLGSGKVLSRMGSLPAVLRSRRAMVAAGILAALLVLILAPPVRGLRNKFPKKASLQPVEAPVAPPPQHVVQPAESPVALSPGNVVRNDSSALEIITNPAGSEVLVDGQKQPASTPAQFSISRGQHRITLRKPGYESVQRSVTVAANTPSPLHVDLVPRKAQASEAHSSQPQSAQLLPEPSQPAAEVSEPRTSGPQPAQLPPEPPQSGAGVSETRTSEPISASGAGVGHVSVHTNPPGAKISVDGKPTVFSSPVNLDLSAGQHSISVEQNGFSAETQEVDVVENQTTLFEMSLVRNGKKHRRFLLSDISFIGSASRSDGGSDRSSWNGLRFPR